ncbi:MAG: hypothetical protein ACE5JI_15760 [Acidobacteriota bacterium]
MPFTGSPTSSVQHAGQVGDDGARAEVRDVRGKLRVANWTYTHAAGAGDGEINLVILPEGRIRVYTQLSRITASQQAAGATLSIGTREFVQEDKTEVAEDADRFANALDTASGDIDETLPLPAAPDRTELLDSQEGVTVYATIAGGNIEDGDTINGQIVYSKE